MRVRVIALCAALFIGGCGTTEFIVHSFPALPSGIHYVETSGNVNVPGMGAIVYVKKESEEGPPVVTLVNGISPNIWQQVLPALISAGGFVAGNAVHGLSLKAAQTAVSTTVSAQGGTATNTNSNTATGGKVCTEAGSGDITGC